MLSEPMTDDFVLWGSGGHAKVLASLLRTRGSRVVALFDSSPVETALPDVPLFVGRDGFGEWYNSWGRDSRVCGAVAIGSATLARIELLGLFVEHGILVPPIVHPAAVVCDDATLDRGSQVLAGAVVSASAFVGEATIVNHRATVDHECVLGAGVHVAPGATVCGCVNIADHAFVGAGAVILPHLRIGAHAVIGAGAVVTRDVAPGATVLGVPARRSGARS